MPNSPVLMKSDFESVCVFGVNPFAQKNAPRFAALLAACQSRPIELHLRDDSSIAVTCQEQFPPDRQIVIVAEIIGQFFEMDLRVPSDLSIC